MTRPITVGFPTSFEDLVEAHAKHCKLPSSSLAQLSSKYVEVF